MLIFERVTLGSLQHIYPYFKTLNYRTCDFTIGGLYMWVDYFKYEYCIHQNTLFIKGYTEDNLSEVAFTFPVGELPLRDSLNLLKEYCNAEGIKLVMSAVPQQCVDEVLEIYPSCRISKLEDWSDYLYRASSLATLAGRKLNKKRNRLNKFVRENPNFIYHTITQDSIDKIKTFFDSFREHKDEDSELANYENTKVRQVLEGFAHFPFLGGYIEIDGQIIAFAIGEIIGDTLFVHIEKALTSYDGSYEAMNMHFAKNILEGMHIEYINREEDVGDPGLRQAKMSYNPLELLAKYNVVIP